MTNKNQKGFHNFCTSREIPIETELEFIQFFRNLYQSNFISTGEFALNYIMNNMEFEKVKEYWIRYVNTLKDKIEVSP